MKIIKNFKSKKIISFLLAFTFIFLSITSVYIKAKALDTVLDHFIYEEVADPVGYQRYGSFRSENNVSYAASGPVTNAVGVALLASGAIGLGGSYVFGDAVETAWDNFTAEDKQTFTDGISEGKIKYKNGLITYTGKMWNWITSKIKSLFVDPAMANPVQPDGTYNGTVTTGLATESDFVRYNNTVWNVSSISPMPYICSWEKNASTMIGSAMFGDTLINYTVSYSPGETQVGYEAKFTKVDGTEFVLGNSVTSQYITTHATGFAFKKIAVKYVNNVVEQGIERYYNIFTIVGNPSTYAFYDAPLKTWNNKVLYFDSDYTFKVYYLTDNVKTYITDSEPTWNSTTWRYKFLNKYLYKESSYSYTYDPSKDWTNSHIVPDTDTSEVNVPVPNLVVTPAPTFVPDSPYLPSESPYGLPQTPDAESENIVKVVDPEDIIINEKNDVNDPFVDPVPNIDPDVDVPDKPIDSNTDKMKIDKTVVFKKFPFSLPKDMQYLTTLMAGTPKKLQFVIPLQALAGTLNNNFSSFGFHVSGISDYTIDLEKSPTNFSTAFVVFRWFTYLLYCAGLITVTKKVMF